MESDDFVPDKAGISKEFKDLKSIDQQKHVLRFDQAVAKTHGKRNRYVIEWTKHPGRMDLHLMFSSIQIYFGSNHHICFSKQGIPTYFRTISIGSN